MSHVDDGVIHAYIDGAFPPGNPQGEEIEAHMALCVDCRVRLDKARELKERAQVVLHGLTPHAIAKPPFEELLARRERSRADTAEPPTAEQRMRPHTRQRASTIFPIPFAWAATVILAVGAGWMGRELVLNQRLAGSDQAAVMMESSEAERQLSQDEAPPSPAGATAAGDAAGTVGGRVDGPATSASAGRADARQELRERPAAEPAAGVAPPLAALKAADSQPPPAVSDVQQQVLQVEPGLRLRAAVPSSHLASRAMLVREYDLDNATTDDARLLRAYLVATRNSIWRRDEVASFGLIGYEAIARLDSAETVSAERAYADDIELLRTVFVVDGDTVELVQQLQEMAVTLDAVVVAGQVDSLTARRRAAAAAAAAGAAPLAANIVAETNRDAAAPPATEAVTLTGDTGNVFAGRNIMMVRRETGAVVLVSRMSADALRAVAAGVR